MTFFQMRVTWHFAILFTLVLMPGTTSAKPAATNPGSVPPSGSAVTAETYLKIGQPLLVEWKGSWWQGEILALLPDGHVKIHYTGWSDSWDEIVPRSRLQLPQHSAEAKPSVAPLQPRPANKGQDDLPRQIEAYERLVTKLAKQDAEAAAVRKQREAAIKQRLRRLQAETKKAQDQLQALQTAETNRNQLQQHTPRIKAEIDRLRAEQASLDKRQTRIQKADAVVRQISELIANVRKQRVAAEKARAKSLQELKRLTARHQFDKQLNAQLRKTLDEAKEKERRLRAELNKLEEGPLESDEQRRRFSRVTTDMEKARGETIRLETLLSSVMTEGDIAEHTQEIGRRARVQLARLDREVRKLQDQKQQAVEIRQLLGQLEARFKENRTAASRHHGEIMMEETGLKAVYERGIDFLEEAAVAAQTPEQKAERERAKAQRIAAAREKLRALARERERLKWFASNLDRQLQDLRRQLSPASGNDIKLINDPVADGLFTEDGVTGYQYIYDVYVSASNNQSFVPAEYGIGGVNGPLGRQGAFDGSRAAWYRESKLQGEEERKGVWQVWDAASVGSFKGAFGASSHTPGLNAPAAIWSEQRAVWDTNVVDAVGRFGEVGTPLPWAKKNSYHTKSDYVRVTTDLRMPGDLKHFGDLVIPVEAGLAWGKVGGVFSPGQESGLIATIRVVYPAEPGKMHWRIGEIATGVIMGPTGRLIEPSPQQKE